MKVKELIEKLQQFDGDEEVITSTEVGHGGKLSFIFKGLTNKYYERVNSEKWVKERDLKEYNIKAVELSCDF